MATKENYLLSLKDKQNNVTDNGQYKNLNLNKNLPFSSDAFSGSSKAVITERREVLDYECICHSFSLFFEKQIKRQIRVAKTKRRTAAPTKLSDFTNDSETKKASHSWNKSIKDLSPSFVKNGFGKGERLKNEKALNASTLSLYIEAYENSNDANLCDETKEVLKGKSLIKKGFNAKQINFDSTLIIQNPFEFTRQQENGEATSPEVAQFRASQQLLNPNLQTHQVHSQQALARYPAGQSGMVYPEDNPGYGNAIQSYPGINPEDYDDPYKKLLEHSAKIQDLSTGNAVVILIFMVLVLAACCTVAGLIYYHYNSRARRWVKITKTMHQRLSKQILHDEKLKELCQKINVPAETINKERKELCPDIEEMVDLPAARYVDPFKAPSNLYEQVNEKDDSAKTLKNNDPDVFLKKEDGGKSTSTNPSGNTKDTAPPPKSNDNPPPPKSNDNPQTPISNT